MQSNGPTTLVDALQESALSDRGILVAGSGAADSWLPYRELLGRARRRLTALHAAGVAAGDEVIIVTDDLETFLAAFWACVLGRIIPVPLAVPATDEVALKILHVGQALTRPWLYTDTELTERLARAASVDTASVLAALGERTIAAAPDCEMAAALPLPASPDDIAFIQFSSGSTGTPKGVTLTHANLIANVSAIVGAIRADVPEPRLVNWMPLTHDFGMICFHILPVVFGFDHCLIPTKSFTRNPVIWMQRCAAFRASVTAGPNYSYRHFLKSRDPARDYGWDLRDLRVILNGAEPIAPELADEFTAALTPYGLPPTAVRGAYGLAEATLVVTMGDISGLQSLYLDRRSLGSGCAAILESPSHPDAAGFAVVGRPLDGFEIRVADGAGKPYPDGVIGTVKLRGPSITRGYYHNPAATRAALDGQGWLDTGDLGFIRDGELVITGRRKDVIIIDGVNYYPQDIERIAAQADGLDLNKVVACAVRPLGSERESLAVFVLFRKKPETFAALARDIADRVTRAIGIPVDYCLAVPRIPKTTSGKIQRFELTQRFLAGGFAEQITTLERLAASADDEIRRAWLARDRAGLIAALAAAAARLAPLPIDAALPLLENGFTSLRLAEFGARLNRALGLELPVTTLFERPTLPDLADALIAIEFSHAAHFDPEPSADQPSKTDASETAPAIAIVGLGLRLPGNVDGPESFWRLLEQGRDAVSAPLPGRWTRAAASEMATDHAGYLGDLTAFDAPFFRLSPAEAEALDPQQRLLLTVSWEALEHAGIDPGALKGARAGVFVGISGSHYRATETASGPYFYTGTAPSVAAGRLSYHYGFTGPCLAIDTACSSSLVALHQAVISLRSGESDLAVVCGVNLLLTPDNQTGLSRMNALAQDGRCKTFDDAADGYGRGEGCVALVAMRLDRALADGLRVLALIRGSAINHDGASNGLTAPNGAAQAAVMQAALAAAGIAPDTVDYLEAHGTGTPLGDPIEVNAAAGVYGKGRDPARPLLLGSVKTAIGHLEAAAGLAGVAKMVLALQHGVLPQSLHFRIPNRHIPWHSLPVRVVDTLRPWPGTASPRRAGVSSFGMSGTNAHVVLEAAPPSPHVDAALRPVILPLSARSETALAASTARWSQAIAARGDAGFADLAFTAAIGRTKFSTRAAIVASNAGDGAAALANVRPKARAPAQPPKIVFAFAGHGSQIAGMGRVLFERLPVFRDAMLMAETALAGYFDRPLTEWLFDADATLTRTDLAQPAVVALQLAFAATLRDWGIHPTGVIGHSLGEIAAAAVAGAVEPAAALRFAAERGRLMQTRSGGAMVAVAADLPALQAELAEFSDIAVAAINGPAQLTLTGPAAGIENLLGRLRLRGVPAIRLKVENSFHSIEMDPILEQLRERAARAGFGEPAVPFYSTLSGRRAAPGEIAAADYWTRQAREPVRFYDALCALPVDDDTVVIELGPRPSLLPLVARAMPDLPWLSCGGAADQETSLLQAVAELFERGADIDWPRLFAGRPGRRTDAPLYPFEGHVRVLPVAEAATAIPSAPSAAAATIRAPAAGPRRERVANSIRAALQGLAGLAPGQIDGDANWFSLGLDSLLIVQLQQALNREYGIAIQIAEVFQHGDTPHRLGELIQSRLPAEAEPIAAAADRNTTAPPPTDSLTALLAKQVEAMSTLFAQQLEVLKGVPAAIVLPAASAPPAPPAAAVEVKGLYRKIPGRRGDWTPAQQAHVRRLAGAYNARTSGSKEHTSQYRDVFANPRSVIGFRPEWKELTYPLHVARADGAHVWDVDDNSYVDITMGFGATLFGHNPSFVRRAIEAELAAGAALGPQSTRAGKVARMIQELTGVERVAFFSTGSEAVMVAVRLARAVTRRNRIAFFTNSYHGTFDGVLAAGWAQPGRVTTLPIADGTPQGMIDDVMVLRYGDPQSLELLREHAGSLAAVLVEPVQSRDPAVQPAAFLQELRALTTAHDIALIFDEVITGFRIHPGGAQHHFGVTADIVTYGKVLGGGMPIGMVAGRARFLDAVDGGTWNYGDDSVPSARTAFIAGTFNAHPLTMAAAEAVLTHLQAQGPALQQQLNARTAAFCAALDRQFSDAGVPIRTVHFASLFRFEFAENTEILNYHLLNNGVFVWEGRNCFLSTAHTDADLQEIHQAVAAGLAAMRSDGWLAPAAKTDGQVSSEPQPASAEISDRGAIARGQREIWFLTAARPEARTAYNETIALDLKGPLDEVALTRALQRLTARHDALRATAFDGDQCSVLAPGRANLVVRDIGDQDQAVDAALAEELATPFDLESGTLFRAQLLRRRSDRAVLVLTAHHIIVDGWSFGLLVTELAALYGAERRGAELLLAPAISFRRFAAWGAALPAQDVPADLLPIPPLALPGEGPVRRATGQGRRLHRRDPKLPTGVAVYDAVKAIARAIGVSPVATLLSAFAVLLGRLADQQHFAIGLPVAGHIAAGMPTLVGHASVVVPIAVDLDPAEPFAALTRRMHDALLSIQKDAGALFRDGADAAPVNALLNVDRGFALDFADLATDWLSAPIGGVKADIFLNVLEFNGAALFDLDYDHGLIGAVTAERWFDGLAAIIAAAAAAPDLAIAALPLSFGDSQAVGNRKRRVISRFGAATPIGTLGTVETSTPEGWQAEGSIGRLSADGSVEILAAADRLVRLANGWVDLDLIERTLADIPGVREAAVSIENEAITAFVAGAAAEPGRLAPLLADLPADHRPSCYVVLPSLPRLENGQYDRAALAATTLPRIAAAQRMAPRTPTEARVAAIWRDVLRVPKLGVTDSFFDLGGHSLKAIAILARIERAFGRAPVLRDFLAQPTVAALCRCLADATSGEPIPVLPDATDYPASSAQARLWMLDQFEPALTAYNIGFVLTTGRSIDATALQAALTRLAERHESLRTALFEVDGEPRQRVLPVAALDFDVLDLRASASAAEAAHDAAVALTAAPFDLSAAPLWRVRLVRLPDQSRIAFCIHHVISDVWSVGVLVRDLMALLAIDDAVALPKLPLQYRDYAVWHNAQAAGRPAAIAAWRDHLLPLLPPLDLPSDRPRPAVKAYRGDQAFAAIQTEAAHGLRALAARIGAGTFAVVTAAIELLLHRLTGREDFLVGSVVAGRDRAALEHVVGFFVNSVPLRVRIDPSQSFEMLACGVRDELLRTIELSEVPLDRIVDGVGVPRDPARNPLFDVVLVLDEREEIRDILHGHGFAFTEIDTPTSQFDFTVYVTDSPAEILIKAVYNSDLFDSPRIERMMRDLTAILSAAALAPDTPVDRLGLAPIAATPSFHQERLWFVDNFERGVLYAEGPTYYNMPLILAFNGPPDQTRLQAALDRLVARHELLRAGLTTDGERPVIEIAPAARVLLTIMESNGNGLASAIADSQRPFDLTKPPLLRAALCGGDDTPPLLCLTAHHAIADRRALAALAAEMAGLYSDPEAALAPPPSFTSTITAPERAEADGHHAHAGFWRAALDGSTPLVLPTDRPRPAVHTFSAGRVALALPAPSMAQLDSHAARLDCARVDLLRAALLALLHRLSGQADIVIGEPVESASTLPFGPLSNLVPERIELLPGETFAALAIRARDLRLTALAHAAMPFDLIVLAVKPKNDMSRTALFDVLFHYDDVPEPPAFGTLRPGIIETGLGWGKYDLTLSIRAHGSGCDVSLVYNRDLFAEATATIIADRFHRLLTEAAALPAQPLAALDILLQGERETLLARAREVADYPRDITVHGAFERVVAAQPQAVAVISAGQILSYDALNRAANRLAHRLRALGVQPDEPVGICLDRDIGIPIAMLGILKAGGGYVPIDPDYPTARARFMAQDSGMRVIVTDRIHAAAMTALAPMVVDFASLDDEAEDNLPPAAEPSNLAYVIYTSGSTGQPKGVMIEHRNVVQLLFQDRLPFSFGPADTWTLFHSSCFDFSVWEMYGALLFGGRLVIVPKHTAQDAPAFLALLSDQHVTVLNQTPTAFYALTEAALASPELPLALRLVIFGGEALQPARLAEWHSRHPAVRLVNMYGITETTVHVTSKVIGPAEIADGRSVIGNPLPSYAIVVVDSDLRLQPPGVPGEICVAGHGVARGYLNRPELTAARFIAHPDLPGQRLYRSGDFGRLDPDGELIYLGRIDDQTKVRGYRIETGEIESQLVAHPLVRDAAVRADGADGLTAWLVAEPALTLEAVLTHLGDKLPDYMLPSRFLRVDTIPVTSNGKVDSKRLRQLPATSLASPLASDDPPRSALEQALAEIWRELIGADQVSRSDNFFELGGHSLKASQAVARIRQRLGRSLSLKDFFSAPTLAALAELIDTRETLAGDCISPAPAASTPDSGYPLSFAQRRLWLLQTSRPDQVNYNMVGAFVLKGALDAEALALAFTALVGRHEVLRTRFVLRRGQPRQIVDAAPDGFALRIEENTNPSAEAALIERILAAELHHVFDLATGPLLRARLVRLPANGHERTLLALNMHHIVADGWSVTVMLRDLERLYAAARAEPALSAAQLATQLPALPIQYKDFAIWQQTGAANPAVAAARRYWLERFEGGSAPLDLPCDRPRPAEPTRRGDIVAVTLDADLSSRLRELALSHEASLFMVLAALVQVQMHLLSGQADVVVGTPVAGRQRLELEPQVGFYLNLLPLRLMHDGSQTFAATLAAMRAVALDALAHQAYPFDRLVEESAGATPANRHPLFDVLLILQNNEPLRLDLADVDARALRDVSITAKYDLNFMFEDKPSLELLLEYAVDLFDRSTAANIAREFAALAAAVANDPRITVAELAERIGRSAAMPPMIAAGAGRAQLLAESW
jgi:amino acid adenylation domain-containing protein